MGKLRDGKYDRLISDEAAFDTNRKGKKNSVVTPLKDWNEQCRNLIWAPLLAVFSDGSRGGRLVIYTLLFRVGEGLIVMDELHLAGG